MSYDYPADSIMGYLERHPETFTLDAQPPDEYRAAINRALGISETPMADWLRAERPRPSDIRRIK